MKFSLQAKPTLQRNRQGLPVYWCANDVRTEYKYDYPMAIAIFFLSETVIKTGTIYTAQVPVLRSTIDLVKSI